MNNIAMEERNEMRIFGFWDPKIRKKCLREFYGTLCPSGRHKLMNGGNSRYEERRDTFAFRFIPSFAYTSLSVFYVCHLHIKQKNE
jgi:hypothetical protein